MADVNPTNSPAAGRASPDPTAPTAPLKKKSPWPRRLLIGGAILIALPALAFAVARMIYNDGYLREQVQTALRDATGRAVTVDGLECSILSGTLAISGLTVPNASEGFKEKDTLRIGAVRAEFSPLSLAFSGGKSIQNLKLRIVKPELYIERHGYAPMETTNIDDLLEKLFSGPPGAWPKQTGLQALVAQAAVEDGIISFRDSDPRLGESRIEHLNISAEQPGLGLPLEAKLKLALATPATPQPGSAEVDARIDWIDAQGAIDYRAFKDILASGKFTNLDMPHLLRYAGAYIRLKNPHAGKDGQAAPAFVCTLGKPHTGTFSLKADTLQRIAFETTVDSDGAVSIFERGKWIAGALPGHAKIGLEMSFADGQLREGPIDARFLVGSSRAALADNARPALLDVSFKAVPGGDTRAFSVLLKTTDELFNSDVAAVLGLKGHVGGAIEGKIEAQIQDDGHARIDGAIRTHDGYVAIGELRQKTAVDATFSAKLEPNADGRPDKAELSFQASAGTSLRIGSTRPARFGSLSDPRNLTADAEADVSVLGTEFFNEFGPLLKVAGFDAPLKESLQGTLRASGSSGKIHLGLDGTLQQQNDHPNPLRLAISGDYDGVALAEKNEQPWLKLDIALKSAADKSVDLHIPVTASQGKTQRVFELPDFAARGDLAGITELNRRFGAYTGVLLGPEYSMAGFIRQSGRSRLVETLDAKGAVSASKLSLGTDVEVTQLRLKGPALFKGAPPLNWAENEALSLKLSAEVEHRGAATLLSIKPLSLKSPALNLEGELGAIDLGKIAALSFPPDRAGGGLLKHLNDCIALLPEARFEASINTEGVRQLQANGVLPPEKLAQGDLNLKAAYDPRTRKATLQALRFRNAGLNLSLSALDIDLPAIAALMEKGALTAAAGLQALPSFAVEAALHKPLFERLKELKLVDSGIDLLGDVALKASYDRAKKTLAVDSLTLAGPGIEAQLSAPAIGAARAAAALDAPPADIAGFAALLTAFQADVKIKPAAFDALKARDILPADPFIRGDLALKASYDPAADRLAIGQASFHRADQSTLPVGGVELSCDGVRLAALLKDLFRQPDLSRTSPALLAHFENGLAVKSLTLIPAEALQCLQRRKIGGTAVEEMLAGAVRFPQPWTIRDLALKPAGTPGTFTLSLAAQTPFSFHQRPQPVQPPAQEPSAWLSGLARFDPAAPLKIAFKDGGVLVDGTLELKDAAIQARRFGFEKPEGAPCAYAFNLAYGGDSSLRVASLASLSGPWQFVLKDFALLPDKISLAKLSLAEGPLKGTLSGVAIDTAADHASATVEMDSIDLGKLYAIAPLSPRLALSGTASALKFTYDGKLSALRTGAFTPEDKLNLSLRPDLRLRAVSGSSVVNAAVRGDLMLSQQRLFSKLLAVDIEHLDGPARTLNNLLLSLEIAPKEPGTLLLNALSEPGLPIVVKVPLRSEQAMDADVLDAIGVVADALAPAPAAPKAPGDYTGIARLRVETSVSAPRLKLGGIVAQNVEIPAARLDALLFTAAGKLRLYGGSVTLEDGGSVNLAAHPIKFEQRVTLANLDVNAATGKPADKSSYELFGHLSGAAKLAGAGFEGAQRRSWNGNMELSLADFVARREKESTRETATKWVAGIVGSRIDDFTGRTLNIFSEDFGLFLNRMEFEPLKVQVAVANGVARIQRGSIIGKAGTKSEGLRLDFSGDIDLPSQTFKPAFKLWLIKLPPATQRQLRLDQLDPADRERELAVFAEGKFEPIILKGPLNASMFDLMDNKLVFSNAFYDLDQRVSRLLKEKKARERGQAEPPAQGDQPAEPAAPAEPAEPKKEPKKKQKQNSLFGAMEDLLKQQIEKRK